MILLILAIIVSYSDGCINTTFNCNQITNSYQCSLASDLNNKILCEYNYTSLSCNQYNITTYACNSQLSEYDCTYSAYYCFWNGQQTENYNYLAMQNNTNGTCVDRKCEMIEDSYNCQSFGNYSCDWQYFSCKQITQCTDFKTVKGCRNTRFKQRCVPLSDGKVLPVSSKDVSLFSSFSCVIQDCKHVSYQNDCTFVNGVQCIWGLNGCSKCADYTTYDSCLNNNGLCYWNSNQCENIECLQYKNPTTCSKKIEQCEWNQLKMKCQLNSALTNQICYEEYYQSLTEIIKFSAILLLTIY